MSQKRKIPEPRVIDLPRRDYQPSKAELEQEFDMPRASFKKVRDAFLRPFTVRRYDPKSND